jgi:site-specific DNA-methyltransferase (adenine-specific)
MTDLATNVLSYGDDLEILRRYLPETCVDLVYLDPPFDSNRGDNVEFRDESGNTTEGQLRAYDSLSSISDRRGHDRDHAR